MLLSAAFGTRAQSCATGDYDIVGGPDDGKRALCLGSGDCTHENSVCVEPGNTCDTATQRCVDYTAGLSCPGDAGAARTSPPPG